MNHGSMTAGRTPEEILQTIVASWEDAGAIGTETAAGMTEEERWAQVTRNTGSENFNHLTDGLQI